MHINSINIEGLWVSYDIEYVEVKKKEDRNRIEITASFFKNGEKIYKIYNVMDIFSGYHGAEMVAKLLDTEYATKKAKDIIESAKRSKHNPFS